MDDILRKQVKILKATQGISYKEIAEEYLEIKTNSFYNWLRGEYNFSEERISRLLDIIETLKEG